MFLCLGMDLTNVALKYIAKYMFTGNVPAGLLKAGF